MRVDVIYVSFAEKIYALKAICLVLRIFNVLGLVVVVNNSGLHRPKEVGYIDGTNALQDFSGYSEGLLYLKDKSSSSHALLVNDTLTKHRFFWISFFMAYIWSVLKLKICNSGGGLLIGELSGGGFGDSLYGLNIASTFSSFFFLIDKRTLESFFEDYFWRVRHDIIFSTEGEIKSKANQISSNYIRSLNGYLGLSDVGKLGVWYRASAASDDIKLDKAKCLVLERLLPTYTLSKGGRVINFYGSSPLRVLRAVESRLFRIRPKLK